MAMTLVDIARGLKDKVMAGIIMQWARQSELMQQIPFEDVDSFMVKTWQNKTVSDAVFRRVGAAYTETKDEFSEQFEGIYLLGGQIDIDRALRLPKQTELDAFAENLALQSERFKFTFHEKFINGDRSARPDEFDGLDRRLDVLESTLADVRISNDSSLDLSSSSANRQTFLDQLHEATFNLRGGVGDLVICGKKGFLSLRSVARRESLLDTTRDQFDRVIETFAGIPFMFAGTKGDQSTEVIGNVELDTGDTLTGGDATSYYVCKFGMPTITGLQMHSPERIFDDITDDGVTHRVVFEWPVGLALFDQRSAVRISGIVPL